MSVGDPEPSRPTGGGPAPVPEVAKSAPSSSGASARTEPGGDEPKRPDHGSGIRRRIAVIARFVGRFRVVRVIQGVFGGADAAGGALLAAGLAFHALFAILPAMLLLTGVAGWVIEDPVRRGELITELVARLPPLKEAIGDTIEGLVEGRNAFGLIGLLGLVWGASSFYGSLDDAMSRLLPGGRIRDVIERRVRGLITVVLLIATIFGVIVLGSVWSFFEGALGASEAQVTFWRLVSPLVTVAVMVLMTLLTYKLVPTAPPSWRSALLPAIVTGVAIGVLTLAFTLIAPRLVYGLRAFGALVAIFATLIWLNLVFQLLIWGAAWARVRRDEAQKRRAASN